MIVWHFALPVILGILLGDTLFLVTTSRKDGGWLP